MSQSSRLPEALGAAASKHRKARDANIKYIPPGDVPRKPSAWYKTATLLDARQVEIIELDATELAKRIAARQYTSVEVTEAYIISACIAHAGTNCLAWIDPEGALATARWLDAELDRNGMIVGPLHGVPLSFKDFINIAGIPQTSGHISSIETPSSDSHLAAIFRQAGAVFIAKTTQPQSIMHLETSSHTFGVTRCSQNPALTCGGSSGGEGALVGCRGSPWGVTTDVGGSTRNPAANNGLWGFKPSTKRVPRGGISGITSTSRVAGTVGPVCHSQRDIELWIKVVLDSRPWSRDVTLINNPWREVSPDGRGLGFDGWSGEGVKMRVGVMRDDGVVRPVKPIRRGIERTIDGLRRHGGFEVVEFEPTSFAEGWEITLTAQSRLYYMDGGEKLRSALGEEPKLPLTEFITNHIQELSLNEVNDLITRRNVIRQQYLDHYNSYNIDILLCPAGPAPAQPIGSTKYWAYTSMWNLLDWPAAVFPTGLYVEEADWEECEAKNEHERHLYSTYDAREAAGSSIGLQVVAPRWQDERLIAALKRIDEVLPLS